MVHVVCYSIQPATHYALLQMPYFETFSRGVTRHESHKMSHKIGFSRTRRDFDTISSRDWGRAVVVLCLGSVLVLAAVYSIVTVLSMTLFYTFLFPPENLNVATRKTPHSIS